MSFYLVGACKAIEGNNDRIVLVVEPITMRGTTSLLIVNRLEDYGAVLEKVQLVIVLSTTPICETYVSFNHDELLELRTLRRTGA